MNYLQEWKSFLLEEKRRSLLIQKPYYKDIQLICNEISSFFLEEDLVSGKVNPDNSIIHLFTIKQFSTVYIISEIAELIRYYNSLKDNATYNLKTKNGKTNHRELQEKLFEIYVNYILKRAGFNPIIGYSYKNDKRADKPVDILLKLKYENCNVEVTKFYDPFKEELLELGRHLIIKTDDFINKKRIRLDELFSGYLAFNKRDLKLIREKKRFYEQKLKEYFHSYRSIQHYTIKSLPKVVADNFEFLMEPSYFGGYENKYDEYLKTFSCYVKFRLNCNIKTGRVWSEFKVEIRDKFKRQNDALIEKIQEKIRQHKTYQGKLLIVIAVEHIFSMHKKGSSMPIEKEHIDVKRIKDLLNQNTVVFIVFKELKPDSLSYDKLLIHQDEYDELNCEICKCLNNINLLVSYNENKESSL